jgi:ribosomal protein S18 acetylase RimI-like enzyme
MPQTIRFIKNENIEFVYHFHMPKSSKKVNLFALQMYGLYRNTVYDSYKQKADLAQDIKSYKKQYIEPNSSFFSSTELYTDPLYHYSVMASTDAISTWANPAEKMQSYVAYQTVDGKKKRFGMVQFCEMEVAGKPVVYIAQAGVASRGQGVGRMLMECVLTHYPAGTEFYICTRIFNTEAKTLYNQALKFEPISKDQLALFKLDERYCGFKHTTTQQELDAVKRKLVKPLDDAASSMGVKI